MRGVCVAVSLALVGMAAYLSAMPQAEVAKVRIVLVDGESGKPLSGIIRVRAGKDEPALKLDLLERLRGLRVPDDFAGWHVVPAAGAAVALPRRQVQIEALSGLETATTRQEVDLRSAPSDEVRVKLRYIFRPEKHELVAGNTHLHLRQMTLEESDDYLRKIPAADGLRVLFISYLERHKDDLDYITNKYPLGNLTQFDATGVLINNGEEHRHNFKGYGEGYGHVMLLNIEQLVKPVSSGPGIMASGFDDTPLRPGIDNARKQGGTIIWCHNNFGQEDILNALTGRLDALNVFDGSRRGGFDENYYNYLNVGVRLPISTGTDWFMYDFARVYALTPSPSPPGGEGKGVRGDKLSIERWLEAVKAGRCQATNGPLLSMTVDGRTMGDVIDLKEAKTVTIEAGAAGRVNFDRLQLIRNGKVIKTQVAQRGDVCRASLSHKVRMDAPGWFAVRIEGQAKNELGQELFAHTSPVYVDMAGKRTFDVDSARSLLRQIEEGQEAIGTQGVFSSPTAKNEVVRLYKTTASQLRERIEKGR